MATFTRIPAKIAIALVVGYRKTLSNLIGQKCRFYPSCSMYSLEAFRSHGFFKGFFMSVSRLLRCNPLFEGGVDPVPKATTHLYKGRL